MGDKEYAKEAYDYLQGSDPQALVGGYKSIVQRIKYSQLTDDGAASGHIDLDKKLPVGAIVKAVVVAVHTAVAGLTNPSIQVGVATDTDRFTADTGQLLSTTGKKGSLPIAADALDGIDSEQTVRVTVTDQAGVPDFTNISAGEFTVTILYDEVQLGASM